MRNKTLLLITPAFVLTLLLAHASPVFAATGARCLRRGIWLSTEYATQVIASRLGGIPGLSPETDRDTWSFNGSTFLLESHLILSGTIDGTHIRSINDGSVESKYRVRRRSNGRLFLVFSNVVKDEIISISEADGIQATPVILEDVHNVAADSLPFVCRRNSLTIRVKNQNGGSVQVHFTRVNEE